MVVRYSVSFAVAIMMGLTIQGCRSIEPWEGAGEHICWARYSDATPRHGMRPRLRYEQLQIVECGGVDKFGGYQ
jgi:hypothetical protein